MIERVAARAAAGALAILIAFAGPVLARDLAPTKQPDETQLETHGHYTNRAGAQVHSPSKTKTGAAPEGATAQCRDQSYSFSQNRRGTCSGHGGVASWLR